MATPNVTDGPVSHMLENLTVHTTSVTNELLAQLAAKIERLAKTLVGNMEVVVTSALHQLAQPIEEARAKLNSPECQNALSIEELQKNVKNDLSNCTQNLNIILHAFEQDSNEFNAALKKDIQKIIDLPKDCESASDETGGVESKVICFIGKIAEINQQIAALLQSASTTLVHTRQLSEEAMETARSCADNVVASTVEYLDKILESCQAIEN